MIEDFYKHSVVIDLETTNIKPDFAEIVELGYGCYHDDGRWLVAAELYKPWELIPPEASSKNQISNRMVEDKPHFDESCEWFFDLLNSYEPPLYLIAHNAKYEETVFKTYSLNGRVKGPVVWLCTFELAKRVYSNLPDVKFYNLGYLRYRLDLDIPDDNVAHRAAADVEVTVKLLERLVEDAIKYEMIDPDQDIGKQLAAIMSEPTMVKNFPFGKHKGVPLKDVPTEYYNWALQNMDVFKEENEKYDPDLLYSVGVILEQRGVI